MKKFESDIKQYFTDFVETLSTGSEDPKIKHVFRVGKYWHKFYIAERFQKFFKKYDGDQLIKNINESCSGSGGKLIVDYSIWENVECVPKNVGAIYIKQRHLQKTYFKNEIELIKNFKTFDDYLIYCIENIARISKSIYPSNFVDYGRDNIFINNDLSWTVVDVDDMFTDNLPIKKHFISTIANRMSTDVPPNLLEEFDMEYIENFVYDYFDKNIHLLDFMLTEEDFLKQQFPNLDVK